MRSHKIRLFQLICCHYIEFGLASVDIFRGFRTSRNIAKRFFAQGPSQGAAWAMTLWIFATATAFSAVQPVQMHLGSVRTGSLPALQPAEQRRQPAVASPQSFPPIFAVFRALRPRNVAGKART